MGVTTNGINLVVGGSVATPSDLTKINTHVKKLNSWTISRLYHV